MKKLELSTYGLEEAKLEAYKEGITVVHDATKAWIKAGKPVFNKELHAFAADYMLKAEIFDFEGAGIIIVIDQGTANTRKYPCKINYHLRPKGRRPHKRSIEILRKSNNQIVGHATSRKQAVLLAKELIAQYKENLYSRVIYTTPGIEFDAVYTPSIQTKKGQYIVFGVEDTDVKLTKQKLRGYINY